MSEVTGENGEVKNSYAYNPYGDLVRGSFDEGVQFGYNGEGYNTNTGMQYLRYRHYTPEQGRFTSVDNYLGTLQQPLSQNRYGYTHNNPVMGNDASGHFFGAIGNFIGGVANTVGNVVGQIGDAIYDVASTIGGHIATAQGGALLETGVIDDWSKNPKVEFISGAISNVVNTAVNSISSKTRPEKDSNIGNNKNVDKAENFEQVSHCQLENEVLNLAYNFLVRDKGYVLAYKMFEHGIIGNGTPMPENVKLILLQGIKNDTKYMDFIENNVNLYKQGQKIPEPAVHEFLAGDLYYAIQHSKSFIKPIEKGGTTVFNVRIKDDYDFTEWRIATLGFSFSNAANDLGVFLQNNNTIVPYKWEVQFNM